MGLDMYAYTREGTLPASVDFKAADDDVRIHDWRKHPDLHGWMEDLYREKGGADADFNCVNLQLTEADLARLEADIQAGELPPTSGFFFGKSDGTEHVDDQLFIAKARTALSTGLSVYYTSWW